MKNVTAHKRVCHGGMQARAAPTGLPWWCRSGLGPWLLGPVRSTPPETQVANARPVRPWGGSSRPGCAIGAGFSNPAGSDCQLNRVNDGLMPHDGVCHGATASGAMRPGGSGPPGPEPTAPD